MDTSIGTGEGVSSGHGRVPAFNASCRVTTHAMRFLSSIGFRPPCKWLYLYLNDTTLLPAIGSVRQIDDLRFFTRL